MAVAIPGLSARAQDQTPVRPAPAQVSNSGWSVSCQNARQGLLCRALNTTLIGKQRLLALIARVPATSKAPELVLHLPHGLFHPAGVSMQIDQAPAKPVPIQTCDAAGCYAVLAPAETEIAGMQMGKAVTVAFQNMDKQTIRVEVPLAGFAAAYAKVVR